MQLDTTTMIYNPEGAYTAMLDGLSEKSVGKWDHANVQYSYHMGQNASSKVTSFPLISSSNLQTAFKRAAKNNRYYLDVNVNVRVSLRSSSILSPGA